jgi:spermidine/putrescine-binding protein
MPESYERFVQETLTRRRFLRRAGLVTLALGAGPALLSACGGGDDDGGGEAAAEDTGVVGTLTEEVEAQATGDIDFLWWQGYDIPDQMADFVERTGIRLKANYIAGHDDIQAKIQAGGQAGSFDLTGYCQCYKSLYAELGILKPLDESKIPNLSNLLPFFAGEGDDNNYWVDADGTRTGVPWTWGVFGINYDTEAIPDGPTTYADLLDSAYAGKVGVVDDQSAVLQEACRYLGLDITALTDDDFAKVKEFVEGVVGQSTGVAPSPGDLVARFVAGEIVLGFPGWAAVNKFAADAGKTTIQTSLPSEGGFTYVDAAAIPITSDNDEAAYAWINELLVPQVNGEAANFLVAGVTVEGAVDFLQPDIEELVPYDALADGTLQEVAPLSQLPPIESDEFVTFEEWLTYWQEVKAGA